MTQCARCRAPASRVVRHRGPRGLLSVRLERLCERHAERALRWWGATEGTETLREAVLRVLAGGPMTATAIEEALWGEGRRPRPGTVSAALMGLWIVELVDRADRPYRYRLRLG